jgi:GNAT superfamily N-acetyltransferase
MMKDRSLLFTTGTFSAWALAPADVPLLQCFFDANPEYFHSVNGEAPAQEEAAREYADLPPAEMPFTGKWVVGFFDADDRMAGMAHVLGDFLAPRVWHIGLYIIASRLHGTGAAHDAYRHLEAWMHGQGARWIRLGVVQGNAKPERFWRKLGYRQVRERSGIAMGRRVNTVRVMVKPLADEPLEPYLAQVARDRPGAP